MKVTYWYWDLIVGLAKLYSFIVQKAEMNSFECRFRFGKRKDGNSSSLSYESVLK